MANKSYGAGGVPSCSFPLPKSGFETSHEGIAGILTRLIHDGGGFEADGCSLRDWNRVGFGC